jgi:hypothetical protein
VKQVAFLLLLGGCASLTGLDDLKADLRDGLDTPGRSSPESDSGDASSRANGDAGAPGDVDGAISPPVGDSGGGLDSAPSATRIRNITFEDKALVHPTSGFDSTFGATQLVSQSPINGAYSMLVDGVGAWGTISFPAVADLYLTVRLRVDPASGSTAGDARVLQVTHAGGVPIEAMIRAAPRDLVVLQGATTLASFPNILTDGTILRFELRMRSAGNVTARLIQGGSSSTIGGNAAIGASSKVEIGALSSGTLRVTFDDIGLDSAVQP